MYSASRAHSPVHRLHSRPPTSYRRWFPSSRSFRLHPIFLIPIFLLGTLFSPFQSSNQTIQEPIYRKEDYDYSPEVVFAKPDAPPLVKERVGDEYGTGIGKKKVEKVLARAGHGEGADEWEWWDPSTTTSSTDDSTGTSYSIYYERQGLLYFPTTPAFISPLIPPPSYPLPKPKPPPIQRHLPLPQRQQQNQLNVRDPIPPHPPLDWLSPGDLFKSPFVRKASSPRRPPALNAPLPPPPARPLRAPINQRVSPAEREAAKRRIGANAQKAQKAKKEGKPFSPGKPAEVREAELRWEKEQEKKRKAKENERLRGAVWAEVKPKNNEKDEERKVLGVDDDDDDDEDEEDDDEEEKAEDGGEDLSDEAILEAVRGLSPEERKLLSKEEQAIIIELEEKYPQKRWKAVEEKKAGVGEAVKGQEGQKRKNFRDREGAPPQVPKREVKYAVKKPVFNPMAAQAAQRRKGGLRKRSFEAEERAIVEEEEGEETESSQFIRRALEEDGDAPSLSDSDRSKRARQGPVDRIHPIQHLIDKAEGEWEETLRRQSQTLEQAVDEYERRYGMKPPVGFDSWWRYAMENRVILVDEYDQIHADMLPFRSLSPSEFRRRSTALQTDSTLPWYSHSFGLGIKTGVVKKFAGGGNGGTRMEDLMDILGEFSEMLPEDVEMRFMDGDEPGVVISGEARERHETLAQEGKFLSQTESVEVMEPSGFTAWDSLCKPNSTARRVAQALPINTPTGSNLRSFVNLHHTESMDLCEHPELRDLNGFTSGSGPRPYLLYPVFSFSKTSLHADLLVPSISNDFYTEVGKDPVWEGKKHNKVLWRGETTGAWHSKGSGWRKTQRARLVALANAEQPGNSLIHFSSTKESDSIRRSSAPTSSLNNFYLDVAYAGGPIQCSATREDNTCSELTTDQDFRWDSKGGMKVEEENLYKYVLDVDANYPSGKFKRLMSSRSLVFKSTIFPEWWSKRIVPWYHYIPIKSDYSDLLDVSAFFIGAPDGTGSHDKLAKRLAANGQKWSKEHWREVDMAAYMFRLYLEYARLLNRDEKDPSSMDYSP